MNKVLRHEARLATRGPTFLPYGPSVSLELHYALRNQGSFIRAGSAMTEKHRCKHLNDEFQRPLCTFVAFSIRDYRATLLTRCKTPSPHRFLQRKARSTQEGSRAASTLRQQQQQLLDASKGEDASRQSHQFASTPRFTAHRQRSSSPPQANNLAQALRHTIRPAESIQEVRDDDDEMLEMEDETASAPLIGEAEPDLPWTNDLAFSPKRRRIDTANARSSPKQPLADHYDPRDAGNGARFTHLPALTVQRSTSQDRAEMQRPTFLRPPQQTQGAIEPLPEAFSPHRRGQKFVPGGMAATVQQWVLETGQTAAQSRRGQGYQHGDDYVMRARVESAMESNESFTARAKLPDRQSLDILLASGRALNSSPGNNRIGPDTVIAIRAPMWELELDHRMWMVAVGWKVVA